MQSYKLQASNYITNQNFKATLYKLQRTSCRVKTRTTYRPARARAASESETSWRSRRSRAPLSYRTGGHPCSSPNLASRKLKVEHFKANG